MLGDRAAPNNSFEFARSARRTLALLRAAQLQRPVMSRGIQLLMILFFCGLPLIAAGQEKETGWSYTNRLIDSRNPYLLLHAHDPVDWYPWGPEAFEKALAENKLIFLSVGYSTCYWCHVAQKTLYSNPDIAKLMNEGFVNIKVDREQRPDLDRLYQLDTQLLTGRGGWPNNVFLTPERKPFFAGSYFSVADDAARGPGFPTVLAAVRHAWLSEPTRIEQAAGRVLAAIEQIHANLEGVAAVPIEPDRWLQAGRDALLGVFDPARGGFRVGSFGHKFPSAPALELLLTRALEGDVTARDALLKTLDEMAAGGLHDQLAGGFHRYATLPDWSVPHFEKMLYDNAQLLAIYVDAFRLTGDLRYRRIATRLSAFLLRDMMSPKGGFYTALDAMVSYEEGRSYLWTHQEIERSLGRREAENFFDVYELVPIPPDGVTSRSGMGGGVLRVRESVSGRSLPHLDSALAKLLAIRDRRPQPLRDEKIVTGLNGLVIEGLVRSAAVLDAPANLDAAAHAAERLWAEAYDAESEGLAHEIFEGVTQVPGFLSDYALLGTGLLSLFEVTGAPKWLDRAALLADVMLRRFSRREGGFLLSEAEDLLVPPADTGDDAYPSDGSAAIKFLLRLSALSDNQTYAESALKAVRHMSGRIGTNPALWATTVVALGTSKVETTPQPGTGGLEQARSADHVAVSVDIDSDLDQIVVKLRIDAGYHVNANPASLDFLVATKVEIDSPHPLDVDYPVPARFTPVFAEQGIDVYEGEVEITVSFPAGSLAGRETVEGSVMIQACNERVCLLPSQISLPL